MIDPAAGDLEILGRLPGASNATLLARIEGTEALVVYKPRAGEAPLWDFPEGTLCNREVAAYEVSAALGWPDIPRTVLREGPLGPGAVQAFVPFAGSEHYFSLFEAHVETFRKVALFDLVVNNADRKGGHTLLGEDGRIWAIDHGICFSVDPKLRTVIWEFSGEPIPGDLREEVNRLATRLRTPGDGLRDRLLELLEPDEVEATAERAERAAERGVYPEPDSARAVPWPPI